MGDNGCGKKKKDDCKGCNCKNGKSFKLCTNLYHQCSDEKWSENRLFEVDRVTIWIQPKKCVDVYYLLDKLSAKVCKYWNNQSVKGKKCNWKIRKEYEKRGEHWNDTYWIDNNPSVQWLACRLLRDLRGKYYSGVVKVSVHTKCGYEAKAYGSYKEDCGGYSDPESYASDCRPCRGKAA